jgi:glutamate--cysteine ligase
VAHRGREPGLTLVRNGKDVPLAEWAREVLGECEPIPEKIDARLGGAAYRDAYQAMLKLAGDATQTPSARVLHAMARNHDNAFVRFALIESTLHKSTLQHRELAREVRERFSRLAQESILKQRELEAADQIDFETFRQAYLAHDLLRV